MRILVAFVFLLFAFPCFGQENTGESDKLAVVWTSDDPELARTMVLMYAHNAKRQGWFDHVTLIIWGPSAEMVSENEEIQRRLAQMQKDGVKIEACIACANMYGVTEKLRELGYEVKGMGKPLSDYLKDDVKVLTF